MRTRRSPRNQEILWRALSGEPPPQPQRSDTVEAIRRMLATPILNRRTRGQLERDLVRALAKDELSGKS
jgi:hypothetical protein